MALTEPRQLLVYQPKAAAPREFVEFWSQRYRDPREWLYVDNIGHPLTAQRVHNLYIWKNGGPLSAAKLKSIEANYISRITEMETLPPDMTASP